MKKRHLDKWQRRRALKQRCVDYLGGKCVVCGFDKAIAALDFHHRDEATKSFEISLAITSEYAWLKIQPELDKTDIYCSNCHRIHHWDLYEDINQTLLEELS